jgi:hypothetical protein
VIHFKDADYHYQAYSYRGEYAASAEQNCSERGQAARASAVFDKPPGIATMKESYPSNRQRRLSMLKVTSSVVINKPVAAQGSTFLVAPSRVMVMLEDLIEVI